MFSIILSVVVFFEENAAQNPLLPFPALSKALYEQKGVNSGRSSISLLSLINLTICGNAVTYAVFPAIYFASPKITVSVSLFCE